MQATGFEQDAVFHSPVSTPAPTPGAILARLLMRFLCLCALSLDALPVMAFVPPSFQGDVFDETNTLTADQQTTLKKRIQELRNNDNLWAAVYVTQSLQGGSIEEAAVTTFEKWALGEKGKDNGLLVVIAPNEHKMRIEVGYGLEGTLTDVFCKQIVDQVYKPAFRGGRFSEGVMNGFALMSHAVHPERPAPDIALQEAAGEEQTLEFNGKVFLSQFGWVLLGNVCVPVLYAIGRHFSPKRKKSVEGNHRRVADKRQKDSENAIKMAFVFFAFFGVFFGLFAAVFSQAMPEDPEVLFGLYGANAIFGLICLLALVFNSRSSVSRRGSSLSSVGSWDSSSSSSYSSSWGSDSSSSSGGGSSGGGGASDSW